MGLGVGGSLGLLDALPFAATGAPAVDFGATLAAAGTLAVAGAVGATSTTTLGPGAGALVVRLGTTSPLAAAAADAAALPPPRVNLHGG